MTPEDKRKLIESFKEGVGFTLAKSCATCRYCLGRVCTFSKRAPFYITLLKESVCNNHEEVKTGNTDRKGMYNEPER